MLRSATCCNEKPSDLVTLSQILDCLYRTTSNERPAAIVGHVVTTRLTIAELNWTRFHRRHLYSKHSVRRLKRSVGCKWRSSTWQHDVIDAVSALSTTWVAVWSLPPTVDVFSSRYRNIRFVTRLCPSPNLYLADPSTSTRCTDEPQGKFDQCGGTDDTRKCYHSRIPNDKDHMSKRIDSRQWPIQGPTDSRFVCFFRSSVSA